MKKNLGLILTLIFNLYFSIQIFGGNAIFSIDTGSNTIMTVKEASNKSAKIIVGGAYDGEVIAANYNGSILWRKQLGLGTVVHDIWCADLNNDNIDEILVANANGHLYCLDINGNLKWDFTIQNSVHLTPMYTVCVVKSDTKVPYVVCGDFSTNIYYLNKDGKLVKTILSTSYSNQKPWGSGIIPEPNKSIAATLRPIPQPDGSDLLFVHATCNQMQSNGEFHVMKPLADKSICYSSLPFITGDVKVVDADNDGHYDVLLGESSLADYEFARIVFNNDYTQNYIIKYTIKTRGTASYRVSQPFVLRGAKGIENYALLSSDQIALFKYDSSHYDELSADSESVVNNEITRTFTNYTYNDLYDCGNGKILLASSQDGGSCIHVINTTISTWKDEYSKLVPIGKITTLKSNLAKLRNELNVYKKPSWQRSPIKVVGFEDDNLEISSSLDGSKSLMLLTGLWHKGKVQEPSWRSPLYDNNKYKDKRDARNSYVRTEEESKTFFTDALKNFKYGVQFWGGHGNDPLYWNLPVLKNTVKTAYDKELMSIVVYPEMNSYDDDFKFLMNNHIYPLMDYMKDKNSKLAFRPKNVFWQGQIYTDAWADVLSGKYADIAIPILEETTDKTQDLSLAGRMGLWFAGSVNSWGVRCSRDDVSYDRIRQFSSQKLSNHFLRKTIYALACGASYIHNSYPDNQNTSEFNNHSSFVLELLAKEALYIPKREEIISISPVHISMVNPQEQYLNQAGNNKWTTFYNKDSEDANPSVFSHMNGSWQGASLTPWDFSTYASGVIDRRYNPIPTFPNGMVLITPVQEGAYALQNQPRGLMAYRLNPIYKDIVKEYITDGVNYLSADGSKTYSADTFYHEIETAIKEGASHLPVLVTGKNVGWVVAEMDSLHLRLTLVDGEFLNPRDKAVTVSFNNLKVSSVYDVLDKTSYHTNGSSPINIDVPCGMFRFIDIVLSSPISGVTLVGDNSKDYLSQNMPNPVMDSTKIAYKLPKEGADSKLEIYSTEGKTIKSIPLSNSNSDGEVTINNSFANGIYYYSLICDSKKVATKRMVIMK